jgi:hypothetical protein
MTASINDPVSFLDKNARIIYEKYRTGNASLSSKSIHHRQPVLPAKNVLPIYTVAAAGTLMIWLSLINMFLSAT